jgi:hypothetical protein
LESKPESKSEAKPETKPAPKAEPEVKPEAEVKPAPKAEDQPALKPEPAPEAKSPPKPEPPSEVKPEPKPEPAVAAPPEPMAPPEPAKSQTKLEPVLLPDPPPSFDLFPEAKPGPKITPNPEPKIISKIPKASSTPVLAEKAPSEKELDSPARAAIAFFALVQRNRIDEAYANLTKGSRIGERTEDLKTLKSKTAEALELFGVIHGYELIETKEVGQNLLRRTYITLGRDSPLRWRFYFYRTGAEWRLLDLRVDDRLDAIFGEIPEGAASEPKP